MAAELDADFAAATAAANAMNKDPGNDVKLRLYALYKQATSGDVQGKRPGFTNPVGRAKYDAWASVSGTSSDDAKRSYVEVVAGLEKA